MSSSPSNDSFHYTGADATSTPITSSGINAEEHSGDYSTQMDELFSDEYETHGGTDAEDNDDEGFVYTGVDAPAISTGYADQIRDVLGSELTDDEMDTLDAKISSMHEEDDNTPDNNNSAVRLRSCQSFGYLSSLQIVFIARRNLC